MKQVWRVSWIRLTVCELNRKLENGEMDINNIISIQRDNSWDSSEHVIVYYKFLVTLKESD